MDLTILFKIIPIMAIIAVVMLLVRSYSQSMDIKTVIKILLVAFVSILIIATVLIPVVNNSINPGYEDWEDNGSGVLIIKSSVTDPYSTPPWSESDVRLIEIESTVGSLAAGTFAGYSGDVYFYGVPTLDPDAFDYPFGTAPQSGRYYTLDSGEYKALPETSLDDLVIAVNDNVAGVFGVLSVPEAPYVLKVPTTDSDNHRITKIGISENGYGPVVAVIADSVTSIDTSAFSRNQSIRTVIAHSLESLGSNAFLESTSISVLDMPRIGTISQNAFSGATGLRSVNLQCSSIGNNAFKDSGITKAVFDNVTTIKSNSFTGCSGIESVTFGPIASVNADSFSSWTFYASDGVTVLEKTAANLANRTFEGSASALVLVDGSAAARDERTLDPIAIEPLQPVERQDLEPREDLETVDLEREDLEPREEIEG